MSEAHKGTKKPWVKGNGGATKGRPATGKQMEGLRAGWSREREPLSPEHLAKLQAGRTPPTPEQREAVGARTRDWWATATDEAKAEHAAKSGAARRGRPGLRGPLNPNWRGGRNKTERKQDMARLEYKAWRKAVFDRDDYTCQLCGVRGGELHADHIKPYATFPSLRYELSNGRTLCAPCHRATPTWGAGALRVESEG